MWRKLVRLGWLVPGLFAVHQADVPTADACTGGEPVFGGHSLRVHTTAHDAERVPVATDGFVVFKGRFHEEELDPEMQSVWLEARDEAGELVPGELKLLHTEQFGEDFIAYWGWRADEPLALGTVLTLTWAEAEEALGAGGNGLTAGPTDSVEIEVVTEPTPLPEPTAEIYDWVNVRHGVGERVECVSSNDCGGDTYLVPTREERMPGVRVSWELPEITGMIAWQAWAEASEPDAGMLVSDRRFLYEEYSSGTLVTGTLGLLQDVSDSFCVVVVVKDLWSGVEHRSQPECGKPGRVTVEISDHDMSSCDEPPTPEARALWCDYHPEDESCEDVPVTPGGGEAGTGSSGPGDSNAGASGTDGPTPRAPLRESKGCQLAAGSGGVTFGVVAALGLASLALRRRRRASTQW